MNIEWNDKLAIGNSEIDGQHKELFTKFNVLLEACKQGKGKEEVNTLLSFLGEYVVSLFHRGKTAERACLSKLPGAQKGARRLH